MSHTSGPVTPARISRASLSNGSTPVTPLMGRELAPDSDPSLDRRLLFEEMSDGSVPGNLHLLSDEAVDRFVKRYGVVSIVRQLATDLAQREAEVSLLRRQHEDRERELKRILVGEGISLSEIDRRLMNLNVTSIRKPDSMLNELISEAIEDKDERPDKEETDDEWQSQSQSLAMSIRSRLSHSSLSVDRHDAMLAPMEMNEFVPESIQPPTLLQTWDQHYGGKTMTDRYGFVLDLKGTKAKSEDGEDGVGGVDSVDSVDSVDGGQAEVKSIDHDGDELEMKVSTGNGQERKHSISASGKGFHLNMSPQTVLTPESTRVSRMSGINDSRPSLRSMLSQDGEQRSQSIRWDEFLRKTNSIEVIQSGQSLGVSGAELLAGGKKAQWKEFKELVYGGVPIAYRPKIWGECSGAWTLKTPAVYENLLAETRPQTEAETQIELDLNRTLSSNVFFGGTGPGVAKLRRVLVAYSRWNPKVGYCQGMNVISAILLLTFATEEDAFWALVSLVDNILPQGYFSESLLTSRADQCVFAIYLRRLLPRLCEHLDTLGVEIDAISFDWFLSCFTDTLPAEVLFRVWDVFLCVEGQVYLFKVALALFKLFERRLLGCRAASEVYSLLKTPSLPVRIEDVVRAVNSFSIVTGAEVKQLRQQQLQQMQPLA